MLFVNKPFTSAAGLRLNWKVECDELTIEDWEAIAYMVGPCLNFQRVEGVPTGGLALAEALKPYEYSEGEGLLIVDDVLTTGMSMERHRDGRDARGLVLFARTLCPSWVSSVWSLGTWLR